MSEDSNSSSTDTTDTTEQITEYTTISITTDAIATVIESTNATTTTTTKFGGIGTGILVAVVLLGIAALLCCSIVLIYCCYPCFCETKKKQKKQKKKDKTKKDAETGEKTKEAKKTVDDKTPKQKTVFHLKNLFKKSKDDSKTTEKQRREEEEKALALKALPTKMVPEPKEIPEAKIEKKKIEPKRSMKVESVDSDLDSESPKKTLIVAVMSSDDSVASMDIDKGKDKEKKKEDKALEEVIKKSKRRHKKHKKHRSKADSVVGVPDDKKVTKTDSDSEDSMRTNIHVDYQPIEQKKTDKPDVKPTITVVTEEATKVMKPDEDKSKLPAAVPAEESKVSPAVDATKAIAAAKEVTSKPAPVEQSKESPKEEPKPAVVVIVPSKAVSKDEQKPQESTSKVEQTESKPDDKQDVKSKQGDQSWFTWFSGLFDDGTETSNVKDAKSGEVKPKEEVRSLILDDIDDD